MDASKAQQHLLRLMKKWMQCVPYNERSGQSQAFSEDEAQVGKPHQRPDRRLSCRPGRWAVRWQGLEKIRKSAGGERGTSIFALAKLFTSWQLDIQGYVRETGWASRWDTWRQVCNGEADLRCQHGNGSWICADSRVGTQHWSVRSYRKESEELIVPVIRWSRKKIKEAELLGAVECFPFSKIMMIETINFSF